MATRNFFYFFQIRLQFEKVKKDYSKASKSNPHVMLAIPIKAIATKAMKFDDVKI